MQALFKGLTDIMIEILKFFYGLIKFFPAEIGNYGTAIVLLTVAVKFALYPLTLQSTRQMAAMQELQPRLQALQKKHKDDPKKLQEETMEFYRQAGVNPLGGCLPMLLQIPFFIALFFALTSGEFRDLVAQPGARAAFLWIKNLSAHDPFIFSLAKNFGISWMMILIGVTTYWSQLVMPQSAQSKQMMLFMPLFIAFISAPFPAGVQIYWVTQNLLTAAQQWYIMRPATGPARLPGPPARPGGPGPAKS